MARRAKKQEDEGTGHGVSAIRGNGYDPVKAASFQERYENVLQQLGEEKSAFMLRCKDIHADAAAVLDEAKGAGIPKKAIKKVAKKHKLEFDLDAIREELEGEDLDSYDQLLQALGELDGRQPVGKTGAEAFDDKAAA